MESLAVEAAGWNAPVGRAAVEELVVVREVVPELVPGKWHHCEDQFSIRF